MAQLIITATVQIPTPHGVSPEVRAAVGRIRSDLRRVMRDIMNQARQRVRAIGPRDTGRMVRGAKVKSVRSLVPGGVSVEFRLSQFYSSFTNESGPREGWFNRIVAEVERAIYVAANIAAAQLAQTYPSIVFDRLVRIAARSLSASVRNRPRLRTGATGSTPSFDDGDDF